MKVAIVHDYIKEYGGAERVLEVLHEMFPKAPVYTGIYAPSYLGPHRKRFEGWDIRESIFKVIPFAEKFISPLRLFAPLVFRSLDLSSYDLIIVSQTGAYFPNFVTKGPTTHSTSSGHTAKLICYTHTPPRYLYGYKTAREVTGVMKAISHVANHFLRMADFEAAQNVDQFIANSEEVASRIEKFYRKKAVVIYPPAYSSSGAKQSREVLSAESSRQARTIRKEYYLTGGRLARAKGVDVIIDAFLQLGLPLKIFGKGFAGHKQELESRIARHSGDPASSGDSRIDSGKMRMTDNIEFVGEVSEEEKFELMRGAKAFVFASYDEDFGITPVEAMSVGTPVIAYKSGGVQETVVDPSASSGQVATGLFYEPNTPEALIKAVKKFEKLNIDPKDCIKQAEKFSKQKFEEGIRKVIEKYARIT